MDKKKIMAANIRWYGVPFPTESEKIIIKEARKTYAKQKNISQSFVKFSNEKTIKDITKIIKKTNKGEKRIKKLDKRLKIIKDKKKNYERLTPKEGIEITRNFIVNDYKIYNVYSYDGFYYTFLEIKKNDFSNREDLYLTYKIIDHEGITLNKTLKPQYLDKLKDFTDTIMAVGDVTGSDPQQDEAPDQTPLFNWMSIRYIRPFSEGGSPKTIFAKYVDKIVDKKAKCIWNSVFSQIEEKEKINKEITDFNIMEIELIAHYDLGLKVYSDSLNLKGYENFKYEKNKINGEEMYISKINKPKLNVLKSPSSQCKNHISIVHYLNHAIPFNEIGDFNYYIERNRKRIFKESNGDFKEIDYKKIKQRFTKKEELVIVTYDIETTYDKNSFMEIKPYSINWHINDRDYFYFGEDCIEVFINCLYKNSNGRKYALLGFNSSRFDNLFLIPILIEKDLLNSVFYQKSSALNITWGGRHTVHDICRFAGVSLLAACENFKTKFKKMEGFDHFEIQKFCNDGREIRHFFHEIDCRYKGIINFEVNLEGDNNKSICDKIDDCIGCKCKKFNQLVKYNTFDVLATRELYDDIEKICQKTGMIKDSLSNHKTIGGMIFKKFIKGTKRIKGTRAKNGIPAVKGIPGIKLPELNIEDYKRTRSGLFAGRTQCYKNINGKISKDLTYFYKQVNKNTYVMLDVKSLYPYVMLNRYYPCGVIINDMSYNDCVLKDLIGFYQCKVNQENMIKNVIPLRSETKSLDWSYKGEINIFLSTVDIKCIKDYGGKVEILKLENGKDDGYAFSDKIHGTKLFECMLNFKKIKDEQDQLKTKGSSEYNPGMREMAKLFLNSLSGKVIENLHIEAAELIRTQIDIDRVLKKCDSIKNVFYSTIFNKNAAIIHYDKRESDIFEKDRRPIYLGCLIYAYARDHMYREIIHDYDVIYQDTDSALISIEEFNRFKTNKPKSIGLEFGQFDFEAGSKYFNSYITLAPKNYFIFGNGPAVKIENDDDKVIRDRLYKKGFKGINLKTDKFLYNIDDPRLSDYLCKKEHKKGDFSYFIKNRGRITEEREQITNKNAFDLYHYGKGLVTTITEDIERFIDKINKDGHAYILSSSIVKSMRNIDDKISAGGVYQRFMIKKIEIRKDICD